MALILPWKNLQNGIRIIVRFKELINNNIINIKAYIIQNESGV